jgi:hypothetical protein
MSASAILKLQSVGFTTEQVTALADLIDTQAATKADLESSEHRLELKMAKIDADVVVLKWMMGFVLAFQVAIFARMFLKA